MKKPLLSMLACMMMAGPALAVLSPVDQEVHDAIKSSCKVENFYDPGDAIGTCFLDDPCDYDVKNEKQKKIMSPFCRHFNDSVITPTMTNELGAMYCGGSYTIVKNTDSQLIFKCSDNRRFSMKNYFRSDEYDTAQARVEAFCRGFYGTVEHGGIAKYIDAYVDCKISEKVCNGTIKKIVSSMKDLTKLKIRYEDGLCKITAEDEKARQKWDGKNE
ncbi:MAG: hypothetical protein K5912_00040 [Alphaproteobacteria bacterium]|nr:hypothetical protein [Alphaproteobacteria bacterium]